MKRRLSILLSLIMLLSMVFNGSVMAASEMYTVKDGDVLWKIAEMYDTTWEELAEGNALDNANLIFPGQELMITAEPDKVITVLATTDMHGRIYPYEYAIDAVDKDAGLAKIQTLLKAERASS